MYIYSKSQSFKNKIEYRYNRSSTQEKALGNKGVHTRDRSEAHKEAVTADPVSEQVGSQGKNTF